MIDLTGYLPESRWPVFSSFFELTLFLRIVMIKQTMPFPSDQGNDGSFGRAEIFIRMDQRGK